MPFEAEIDTSESPLIVANVHGDTPTADQWRQFFADFVFACRDTKTYYATVTNSTIGTFTADMRKVAAQSLKDDVEYASRFCVACGVVLYNRLARGAFTAILWLFRPPMPIRVFGSVDEAKEWAREMLRKKGSLAA